MINQAKLCLFPSEDSYEYCVFQLCLFENTIPETFVLERVSQKVNCFYQILNVVEHPGSLLQAFVGKARYFAHLLN